MDIRRGIAGLGRTLIALGVLILLFVAYQLWGTGIAEARAQDDLFAEFRSRAAATPSTPPTSAGQRGETAAAPTTTPPRPVPGDAVAIIRIPRIGVEKAVVEGVSVKALKKGPGHYPGTPMPGQPGNAAIAGHRTTYGAPFFELDKLEPGDDIEVTTHQGEFTYTVTGSQIVRPNQSEVLDPTEDNRLTLTTCHPRYSARQRLIVTAELVEAPAPAPPAEQAPPAGQAPADEVPEIDNDGELASEQLMLDDPSLSGDAAARGPAFAWGALAAGVWLITWLLSRRWGKVPAYALGTPVFLIVLFVFFENFARLLPANM